MTLQGKQRPSHPDCVTVPYCSFSLVSCTAGRGADTFSPGVKISTCEVPMHDKIFLKKTRTYLLRAVALATILTCFIGIAAAQEAEHKWTANLGAGFTPLVGALDQ